MVKYPRIKNKEWLRYAYIGPHMFICTVIGGALGYWIDHKIGTTYLFTLILGFLGVTAGFINLFRELAHINKEEQSESDDQDEG